MMKCKVCETEFEALDENKYVAKDVDVITGRDTYWDCFDCPKCGCQVIGYRRLMKVGEG